MMSSVKWEPIARSYNPLKAGSIDGTDTIPHDHGVVRAMQVCFYQVSKCSFLLLFIFLINVDSHLSYLSFLNMLIVIVLDCTVYDSKIKI